MTGVAVGCGDDDDKKSSAKPAGFAMEATAEGKKLALSHPASVQSGLVSMTLKNSDKGPRAAQIVRIEGSHNSKAVVELLQGEDTKIPEYIQDGGGVAAVKPGETKTVTQNLAQGAAPRPALPLQQGCDARGRQEVRGGRGRVWATAV